MNGSVCERLYTECVSREAVGDVLSGSVVHVKLLFDG